MTAVRSEDGARKVQWVSGSDAGIAHAAISLPCVAEQCEQCARMAEGQGASWPESIPLSGAASECQLTSWLAVKGRGAKKKTPNLPPEALRICLKFVSSGTSHESET